jgi:biopolymer transport protein ExbD
MAGNYHDGDGIITGINITPLVDITLVLLIVFMVTAKMMVTPAVSLDLPEASQVDNLHVVFSVTLPQTGPLRVNGEIITDDHALLKHAQAAFKNDANTRAIIQADGDVPHRKIMNTVDLLKQAGLNRIAFAAIIAAEIRRE